MSAKTNNTEIMVPNYALTDKIQELNADVKASTAVAIGGLAMLGAGAAGIAGLYSQISGERLPVVEDVPYVTGTLALGLAVGAGSAKQSIGLRKQRRALKKQERQEKTLSAEHYKNNEGMYQEQALHDATTDGVEIKGWTEESVK